jgi:hypothetical protein
VASPGSAGREADLMSAEREPMRESGVQPQKGPGAKPLVRGQGAKPPEATNICTFLSKSCLKI